MFLFLQIVCVVAIAVAEGAYTNPGFYRQQYNVHNYNVHRVTPQVAGPEAQAKTLRSTSDIQPDGSYSYSYETDNGIAAQESGIGGKSAQGSAQWTAPDGTPIQFTYVADENGYQPVGSHIPTPPPMPEHVQRALAWIAAHPSPESTESSPLINKSVLRAIAG